MPQIDYYWQKLKKEVIETDLYSQSGTEVGLSEGILQLRENQGEYFPLKVKAGDISRQCYEAASVDRFANFPAMNAFVFGRKKPNSWLFGEVKKYYLGYATDPVIRQKGASGGVLTAILIYLLQNSLIEGAIVLRMRKDKPYLTEPIIATKKEEILQAAQSKYTIAPVNQILQKLPGSFRSLAYVGLPHQVFAIRKLQQLNHHSIRPINYVLGPFYGNTLKFSAITSFLKTHGVKDLSQVKSLAFRAGEWPGYMRVELKNGRVIAVRKFHANYLIPFHITKFSLYQVDQTNEFADISVGDGWAPQLESKGEGWSVVLARTKKGLKLIEKLRQEKTLTLKEITFNQALKMHSHGIDFKKRGAFIRIEKLKKQGKAFPCYGYRPVNIPRTRIFFEKLLDFLFTLCSWRFSRWLVEKLPVNLTGKFFVLARQVWKRITRPTKHKGLTDLKFEINDECYN